MAHLHDALDWTVDVYIVNDGAVLLRKHDKYKLWLVPGGHIELDELPTDAAIREAKEETGLDIELVGEVPQITEGGAYKELLAPLFMNVHPINETHSHISLVYAARTDSRDIVQGEGEISDEMRWFTKEELESSEWDLQETIRHYGKRALEVVG